MRIRGLVFERFVTFERAEVSLCDESGAPLDVVLFVGESGSGKSSLLHGISSVLAEAGGGEGELGEDDIRRNTKDARCRVVFDDVVGGERAIITLEKEIVKGSAGSILRATPQPAFDRWRCAVENSVAPKAAFSVASSEGDEPDDDAASDEGDHLFAWFASLHQTPQWDVALSALDRVLWPCRFDHVGPNGHLVFVTPSGRVSAGELGDAFDSVLVMTLDLLHLSTARPDEELVYVIDDIDAHLHPRLEARLIDDLRHAFPRVQLVASTHSPWVAASVEPNQVFRLERSGGATNVVRVSDRVKAGALVSSVVDLGFGAPELRGPKWLHSPTLPVRREVLRALEGPREGSGPGPGGGLSPQTRTETELPRGAVVYALPDPIHVKDVRDAFGEQILPFGEGSVGHVFFVDFEPGVAWGHTCEYVFRARDGKLYHQRALWPPADLDRFVPIGRG